jgi:GMP synthase (glutamine-hydrolysing)
MAALRILILDNTREERYFGSQSLLGWVLRMAPAGSQVMVRRPPGGDLPLECAFDAICISGSVTSCMTEDEPWIREYDAFVSDHIRKKTPILGICFGHQTLARCLFRMAGQKPALGRSKDAELGWQTIQVLEQGGLFEGLGESFVTYQSHYEEVSETPPGTIRLAETDRCAVQAFQVKGAPIFGIQFHPEHSVEYAEESLANKLKKGERRDWILNPGLGTKLYDENVGIRIFGNFFRIAES